MAEFLGPDLVREGLEPGLRCDGRQQAMSVIRNRFAAAPLIFQAAEAIEAGQHVIVGLRGPGFNGTPGDLETVGQIFGGRLVGTSRSAEAAGAPCFGPQQAPVLVLAGDYCVNGPMDSSSASRHDVRVDDAEVIPAVCRSVSAAAQDLS
jgi:hypothetical protein